MCQITVGGGLVEYPHPGMDAFVFVFIPAQAGQRLPEGFSMVAWRGWQGEDKPHGAYYTVRRARPDELDLWFVLHGDEPPGTSAVLLAAVQDELLDIDGLYVFGAAATKRIADVRRYLKQQLSLPAHQMHLTGYWRARQCAILPRLLVFWPGRDRCLQFGIFCHQFSTGRHCGWDQGWILGMQSTEQTFEGSRTHVSGFTL